MKKYQFKLIYDVNRLFSKKNAFNSPVLYLILSSKPEALNYFVIYN